MRKTALTLAVVALGAALAGPALAASCHNTGSYERWLEDFKKDAAAQGISPRVIAAASPSMTFDPAIIRRDHGQAVFNQTFLQFSDRMVGGARIPNGLAKIKQHAALFAADRKEIRRAGAGAHRLLGPGERLRRQFRQLQNPERAGDARL